MANVKRLLNIKRTLPQNRFNFFKHYTKEQLSMDGAEEGILETTALGRPFQLGMLYDCRKDAIVPGITLWDRDQLQLNTVVCTHPHTEFTVSTSDTINDKTKHLEVKGDLRLSLLAGLFTINGAARYFKDTKKSFIQERLTLHYKTNVRYEQLSMNHLAHEKMAHHAVFDNDTVTHVVTGLEYGANAYFVFDREVSSDEDKKDVMGEVKIATNKLKYIDVSGTASLKMDKNEKNALRKFKCTFHGDFKLPSNPTTFEDAVEVYADLPNMLGKKGEHAVPLRVYLYPLVKLNSRAAKVQSTITPDFIRDLESVIETLNETEMKCRDLMEDTAAKSFKSFHSPVQDFQKFCSYYKLDFMSELGSLLPAIRGGQTEISVLTNLLLKHEKSPFNKKDLQQWMLVREKKSKVVKALLKQLCELGAEVCEDIEEYLLDRSVMNVVSYAFTSLQQPDAHLNKQQNYLKPSNIRDISESNKEVQDETWVSSDLVSMRNHLDIFEKLVTCCKNQSTKFIVQSLSPTSELSSGSCILIYEGGCGEHTSFSPPSKPSTPDIESVTDNSVTVKLGSSCPATLKRNLLYRMKQEKEWKSQHVHQDVVKLADLQHGTSYEMKCEAVGQLNYTVESDVIHTKTTQTQQKAVQSRDKGTNMASYHHNAMKLNDMITCFRKWSSSSNNNKNNDKTKETGGTLEDQKRLQTGLKLVLMGKSNSSIIMDTIKREINAQTDKSSQQSKMIIGEVIVEDTLDSGFRPDHVSQSSGASHDYYLLVVPADEPTEEYKRMLNRMEEIFGKKCWRNTVIIFTDTKEGQSENQDIMTHVQERGISFLCLNVHENINSSQVLELLKKVEMKFKTGKDSEIFKVIESLIRTVKQNIIHILYGQP